MKIHLGAVSGLTAKPCNLRLGARCTAWHALRVLFGCKSKQKILASDSSNENRSVRPVAPPGQLDHPQGSDLQTGSPR
jgi:hypothetical protein